MISNAGWETTGLLGPLGTWLACVPMDFDQHQQVFFCSATFKLIFPKPAPLHEAVMTQEPFLAFSLLNAIQLGAAHRYSRFRSLCRSTLLPNLMSADVLRSTQLFHCLIISTTMISQCSERTFVSSVSCPLTLLSESLQLTFSWWLLGFLLWWRDTLHHLFFHCWTLPKSCVRFFWSYLTKVFLNLYFLKYIFEFFETANN